MGEIRKFDLDSQEPVKTSSRIERSRVMTRRKKQLPLSKKYCVIFAVVAILLFITAIFALLLPAQKVYQSAMKTYASAKVAYALAKKQNVQDAGDAIIQTQKDLAQTQKDLAAISYLTFIPLLNNYYNDVNHLAAAGQAGLQAASLLVDSVKPYADVLGLKGQGSFVMGSAEQRIQTAILTLDKITPRIDDIAIYVEKAQTELDQVDPHHYPGIFGLGKIQQQLQSAQTLTDESVTFVKQARPLIKVLPNLLGSSQEKKYLVLFQNDKELRATGGFITAYAIFRIDKGIINVETSNDIYTLDDQVPNKPKAPDPILKYLPKVYSFNMRDSNLSPDYVESMKTFSKFYNSIPGHTPVDGILALDTHVLVTTIKILDDAVSAGGITFTTKQDSRCNCPQVIYVLEDNISRPVGYIKTDRKGLLGQLLYAIMQKALKSSPKLYWGPLLQNMLTETGEKHVLFDLANSDAQSGIESLNAAGRIKSFDGDYLHINDTNFSGAKTNLYVTQAVTQDINVASDGTITKTLTINFKDPFPPSDCNLERGGLCLNSIHRDWIRIYVPKGSQLVDSQGSEVKVSTYDELGKTVFDGFLEVRPQGAATYVLKYRLPFKLASNSMLPLLIQKQPGTNDNDYTVKLNGHQTQEFPLLSDKQLNLKM